MLENRSLLSATVASVGTATDKSFNPNVSVTAAAPVPANNTLIVEVAADPTSSPVSVNDNRGNAYHLDANVTNSSSGGSVETWVFSASVATGLLAGDQITVHFSGPPPTAKAVSALSVGGLVLSNKLDRTHTGSGTGGTPNSGPTSTTNHPDELLVGAIGVEGPLSDGFAPGGGFASVGRAGTNGSSPTSNVTINPEYRPVSATGVYYASGTLSTSRDWGAAIATYVIDTVPVVTQPSDQTNTEGDSVNLPIVASDSDGDALTYSQTGLPPGLSINAATGVVTGNVNTTYANHGPYSVSVTATDPAGHSDTKSFTWNVTNVAPTVLDHTYGWDESTMATLPAPGVLSGSSDPGNEALQAVLDTDVSHGTLALNSDGSFTYTPTTGYTGVDSFTYHANDGLADSNVATVTLNVSDVTPPVITPTGNQTNNENDMVNVPVVANDADGDTLFYSATGLPDGLSIDSSTGVISGTIAGSAADQTQPFNVDVAVSDGSNTAHDTFTWTVNNVAPVLTANNVSLAEGILDGPVTIATFTDVGGPEPLGNYTATIDWGDGTTPTAGVITQSGGVFTVQASHAYAEESTSDHTPGGLDHYVVTVTIDDNNGISTVSSTETSNAMVSDPAVAPNGGFTVTAVEGADTGMQTVATFVDPGGAEALGDYSATIDWGDGTTPAAGSITETGGVFTVQGSHTYAEESGSEHPGSTPYVITVTIHHETALDAVAVSEATVSDPPVVAAGGFTLSATEGAASGLQTVATFTDPGGPEAVADYSATIDWGDGTSTTAGSITETGGVFTVQGSHTYAEESAADHPGSNLYQITVTISHENATPDATVTSEADVADPAVVATGGFTVSATEGAASGLQTVATFTDPGGPEVLADYSASIDWGDGSSATAGTITESGGTFTVQGSHTYAEHVNSPIHVTISHESAPNATADSVAEVAEDVITATGVAVYGYEFSPLTNVKLATFTHAGGIEPTDEFKATIEWGDGTSSAGTVSLVSGVYTVDGSHTYTDENSFPVKVTIEDSAAGDTASATVNTTATILEELLPGGVRGTADQRWISEVYRDLLNRPVDPTGLSHWGSLLAAGKSREQIVLQIESTHEFVNDEVEQLYQRYLHRSADAGGLAYYSGLLEAGKTVEQISALLASSDEFFTVQGGGTEAGFLNALYQDALGRSIDPTGEAWWSTQLSSGASRTKVVDQILGTQEYRQDVVKYAYEQLLDRQADADGLNGWVARMNAGATDQQLFAGIAASQEFYDKTAP